MGTTGVAADSGLGTFIRLDMNSAVSRQISFVNAPLRHHHSGAQGDTETEKMRLFPRWYPTRSYHVGPATPGRVTGQFKLAR